MNKHEAIIKLIKDFCINASKDADDVLNDGGLTDGSEGIYEGRYELAESLLEQIKTWEAQYERTIQCLLCRGTRGLRD